MGAFWWVLALVIVVVVGNALLLLRTAKHPEPRKKLKAQPDDDGDESGW